MTVVWYFQDVKNPTNAEWRLFLREREIEKASFTPRLYSIFDRRQKQIDKARALTLARRG